MTSPAEPRRRRPLEDFTKYFETMEEGEEGDIHSLVVEPILKMQEVEGQDFEDIETLRGRVSKREKGLSETDKRALLKKIEELVDSYFPQKERLPIVRWFLPKKDIPALLKQLLEIENPQMRQEALKILDLIPQKERATAIYYVVLLFEDIEEFVPDSVFQAIQQVEESQRGKTMAAAMPLLKVIKNAEGRAAILGAAGMIDMYEMEAVIAAAKPVLEDIEDGEGRARIIEAARYIPEDQRAKVIEAATPLQKLLKQQRHCSRISKMEREEQVFSMK